MYTVTPPKKMNICLIITNLSGGGAERASIDLGLALSENGHNVTMLLLENTISYDIPEILTIECLQKKGPYLHGYFGKRVLSINLKKKWIELNKKINFDITISRLPFANEVVKLAKLPNPFFVVDTEISKELLKIKIKSPLKAFRLKQRYQNVFENSRVIAISKIIANDLSVNFKKLHIHEIYNPIDINKIKEKSKLKDSNVPSFPYVLHIGRAIDAKRHDVLLDAWRTLKTKHKLILITDDVLKIKAMVKNRDLEKKVDVIEFKKNPYPWIKNADFLILCSDFEGFGLVLAEALICNTRILSTNFAAVSSQIFPDLQYKELVPRGNPLLLAKAMKKYLGNKSLGKFSINLNAFAFKNIASQYEALLEGKSALLLKTKNIGDSIILTSSINALPKEYRYIDIVCFKESEDIFKMHPRVRNIFIVPRHLSGLKKLQAYLELIKKIYPLKYDLLIQYNHDWRGALIARLKKIDLKVSRESDRRGSFWHNSFHIISPIKSERYPAAEQDLNILRSAHLFDKNEAPKYTLIIPPDAQKIAKQWIKSSIKASKNKLILIHAPARWSFKQIPLLTWVRVIDQLHQTRKFDVILNGSVNNYIYNQTIAKKCKSMPAILKAKSLTESAAVMEQVDLIISIDSMTIHLASALSKKTVGIFGPTDEANWGSWQTKHETVSLNARDSQEYSCRPCGRDGCNGSKVSDCLVNLPEEKILQAVNKMLAH
jgi:heptosyltransferase III